MQLIFFYIRNNEVRKQTHEKVIQSMLKSQFILKIYHNDMIYYFEEKSLP